MAKNKKYFPNNWKAIAEAPSEYFFPLEFDELMDWKIGGYEIPSSIAAIIREHNLETGKVSEYVYQSTSRARNRANKIMAAGKSEFMVCTHDEVHHVYPQSTTKQEDDYDAFA